MKPEEQQQQIVVRLVEQQDALWRQFSALTNEMIIRKGGRKIFPNLDYHIEGLVVDKLYVINLEFHQVDDFRYKFEGKWVIIDNSEMRSAEANKNAKKIQHEFGVMKGKEWMDLTSVNFDHVKLTNDSTNKSYVFLTSMHKYVPVLSIYEVLPTNSVEPNSISTPVAVFRFEHTEFITVTTYKNRSLGSLKGSTNPSAKGIHKVNNNKRRRSFSNAQFSSLESKRAKVSPTTDIPPPMLPQVFAPNPFMLLTYLQLFLQATMMVNAIAFQYTGLLGVNPYFSPNTSVIYLSDNSEIDSTP